MSNNLTDIDVALAEIRVLRSSFSRLESTLEALREAFLQNRLSHLPACDVPITDHRREHRMGRVPKIATDPELQAFILARIDRLTYQQIADELADHFPAERQVRKSAIYDWWQRRKRTGMR